MTLRPCLDCGTPTEDARCHEHRAAADTKPSPRARGYDARHDRLSRRLRRDACCSVCGTRDDLQLDHLPGSWERAARGHPLRPGIDVDVKCGRHNREAGAARGHTPRGDTPPPTAQGPQGEANFGSHTPEGYR